MINSQMAIKCETENYCFYIGNLIISPTFERLSVVVVEKSSFSVTNVEISRGFRGESYHDIAHTCTGQLNELAWN